jgi:hypothetical protein
MDETLDTFLEDIQYPFRLSQKVYRPVSAHAQPESMD